MSLIRSVYYNLFYKNPLVNPGEKQYLSYYLEDRNFITFTRQLGTYSNAYLQDFQSLPFSRNLIVEGTIIPDLFQNAAYQVSDGNYATFNLMKPSGSTRYNRQFTKIDTFFSYVGELVGSIIGLMIFVSKYTQFSFEIDISKRLFSRKDGQPSKLTSSIVDYLHYLLFCIFRFTDHCEQSPMKEYFQCRRRWPSIEFILRRGSEEILNQHQIENLFLRGNQTILKLRERRKQYSAKPSPLEEQKGEDSQSNVQSENSQVHKDNSVAQMNQVITNNMEVDQQIQSKQELRQSHKDQGSKAEQQKKIEFSRKQRSEGWESTKLKGKNEGRVIAMECQEIPIESVAKQSEFAFVS